MIDDRKYPNHPEGDFDADSEFRAELYRFRANTRIYATAGTWPMNN